MISGGGVNLFFSEKHFSYTRALDDGQTEDNLKLMFCCQIEKSLTDSFSDGPQHQVLLYNFALCELCIFAFLIF